MRISDWSSDVCSSDLVCDERPSPSGFDCQRIAASRGQGQQARIWMDRWVPMCMIGAYGLRQGDGGLFWRLRGRVKVAYSRWFPRPSRSEEHTSELQSLMRISYAVFCLKKKKE